MSSPVRTRSQAQLELSLKRNNPDVNNNVSRPMLVIGPICCQYRFGEELDGGGKVFVATDKETGEERAIRRVKLDKKSDVNIISTMVKQLLGPKHTNIVKYQGAFLSPKKELYLTMTLCTCSLMSVVPLSPVQLVFTCKEVVNGLSYIHSKGLVHGAVRASNVLLDKEGRAKLADWGLHSILGKDVRQWDAPEIRTGGEASMYSDIWSFGVLMVECVLGKLPYQNYRLISPLSLLDNIKDVTDDHYSLARECLTINIEDRPKIEKVSRHKYLQEVRVDREVGKQMMVGMKIHYKSEDIKCVREKLECGRCGEVTDYSPVFMSAEGTTSFQCDHCIEVESGHMDCEKKNCVTCAHIGRVLRERWERQKNLDKLVDRKMNELFQEKKSKQMKKTSSAPTYKNDWRSSKTKEENLSFDSLIGSVKLMQAKLMRQVGPEVKDGFESVCEVCGKLRICLKVQGQRYCCMTCVTRNTRTRMVCSMCSSRVQFQSGKVSVNGDYFCHSCVEQLATQAV